MSGRGVAVVAPEEGSPVRRSTATHKLLEKSIVQAARRRRAIQIPCLGVGFLCMTVGATMYLGVFGESLRPVGEFVGLMAVMAFVSAILPTDRTLINVAYLLLSGALAVGTASHISRLFHGLRSSYGWLYTVYRGLLIALNVAAVAMIAAAFVRRRKSSRWRLNRLWTTMSGFYLGRGLISILHTVWVMQDSATMAKFQNGHRSAVLHVVPVLLVPPCSLALGVLASLPDARQRLHGMLAWFNSLPHQAAGIASFLNGRSPREMLIRGQAAFRGVRLSALKPEDLQRSYKPQISVAESVTFGEIDAFVSHSWSDDAQAKWNVLSTWCRAFTNRHGREPILWIDKFSVNQANVAVLEEEISCLPVFLSGCRSVLVLAGPSYPSRLWCVAELWLAHQMGWPSAHIHVEVLPEVNVEFEKFDARRAQCSRPEDTERLQLLIEMSGGGVGELNKFVKELLSTKLAPTALSTGTPKPTAR